METGENASTEPCKSTFARDVGLDDRPVIDPSSFCIPVEKFGCTDRSEKFACPACTSTFLMDMGMPGAAPPAAARPPDAAEVPDAPPALGVTRSLCVSPFSSPRHAAPLRSATPPLRFVIPSRHAAPLRSAIPSRSAISPRIYCTGSYPRHFVPRSCRRRRSARVTRPHRSGRSDESGLRGARRGTRRVRCGRGHRSRYREHSLHVQGFVLLDDDPGIRLGDHDLFDVEPVRGLSEVDTENVEPVPVDEVILQSVIDRVQFLYANIPRQA